MIVDTDGDRSTIEDDYKMQDRDRNKPPGGMRKSLKQIRFEQSCKLYEVGDSNDHILSPYDSCVFKFTEEEFKKREHKTDGYVDLYVDHGDNVFGWIETCERNDDGVCTTVNLERGLEYRIYEDEAYEVQFLFENDSPKNQFV